MGSRPQVAQRLAILILQMRLRARAGLKSNRKIGNSVQAWRSSARGNHLDDLGVGMILREWRQQLGDCWAVHFKQQVCKVPGPFLHSISHAEGTGRRGEEAPCCFKAGKEANWSTILRMCAPRLQCSGRLLVLSFGWLTLDQEACASNSGYLLIFVLLSSSKALWLEGCEARI